MVLVLFLYLSEINAVLPTLPEIKSVPMDKLLPTPSYDKAMKPIKEERKFEEDGSYYHLGQFNMFDPKSVKTSEQIEAEVMAMFEKAKVAERAGNYKEVVALCNRILIMKRAHSGAESALARAKKELEKASE